MPPLDTTIRCVRHPSGTGSLANAPAALEVHPHGASCCDLCLTLSTVSFHGHSDIHTLLFGGGAGSESPSDDITRCLRCSVPVWHRFSTQRPALKPNLSTVLITL